MMKKNHNRYFINEELFNDHKIKTLKKRNDNKKIMKLRHSDFDEDFENFPFSDDPKLLRISRRF